MRKFILLLFILLAYSFAPSQSVVIKRNVAWNTLVLHFGQFNAAMEDVHTFLVDHETELNVQVLDLQTRKKLDLGIKKCEDMLKDLKQIRKELTW